MSTRDIEPTWHPMLWVLAAGMLAIPAAAMQMTNDVRWGPGDFLAAAVLLGLAALGIELALRIRAGKRTRVLAIGAVLIGVALVWAELAVGLFD